MTLYRQSVVARCIVLIIVACGPISLTAAQPKQAVTGHNVVDVVSLKSGRVLRGAIVWRESNGSSTMVVSQNWLQQTNPAQAAEALALNVARRKSAWTETRDRIDEQLKSPSASKQVVFFLQQERDRLNQLIADPAPADPEFLWFDLSHESIGKIVAASADQRRVALFAWNEGLAHVETRDAAALSKELASKGVKLDGPTPDLSDRLPARSQTDEEWSARLALVEYTLDKPVDFQGMGDTIARTGDGQPINLGEVLPKILQGQLGSLLKELTNEGPLAAKPREDGEWMKQAIREAELAKARGFRVTRLEVDAATLRATVDTRFVARIGSGKWQTVWRASITEDGTKPRPAAEQRIEQDPQLKTVIDTLKTLGLADPKSLQQAIRFGAATMAAQQSADATFGEFRDGYTRRLDGPPLHFATGPSANDAR